LEITSINYELGPIDVGVSLLSPCLNISIYDVVLPLTVYLMMNRRTHVHVHFRELLVGTK